MAIVDVLVDEERTDLYHPVMMIDIVRLLAQSIPGNTGVIKRIEKGPLSLPGRYVWINPTHSPHL
jgi:hypothetical protein